jgi:8-oxo-dGTP pyrophosphatase MutT (NUDIX family)
VLICQRKADKRHGLLWEFPGGKLLQDETLGEAVQRELAEELDLGVSALGRYLGSHQDPGAPFLIHFVEARVAGEPAPREHERIAWVPDAELASHSLAPGDRAFVEAWLGRTDRD